MNVGRVFIAAALAAGFAVAAHSAPLAAYGGLPTYGLVDVSPDGSRVALAVSNGEQVVLTVQDVETGAVRKYGVGSNKIRSLDWVTSDHLIITSSQTATIADLSGPRREWLLGFDLNLTTNKIKPLLEHSPGEHRTNSLIKDKDSGRVTGSLNTLAGLPKVRTVAGVPTLFVPGVSFPDRRGVLTMFKVNLATLDSDIVALGDRYMDDIILGEDGAPVATTTYDPGSGRWALRLRSGAGWKEIRVVEAKTEPPYLVGLGRDGRSVLVGELADTGFVIREVSLDGVWSDPLDVRDADGPIFDPATHRLIGVYALVGDEERYTFFNPDDQKAWGAVKGAFKGQRVHLQSWSQDRKRIVVLVDSPTEGPAYALVDLAAKRATWLGGQYQQVVAKDIGPVQPVRFKAADGTDLTGYLTLPNGAQPKNLPLVVFPHGGPASRDTPGFDWWAQAMASRGYAVLQVNFRGSDGFGWSFLKAGFGQWGRSMQTDLSDGVRFLAKEGVIDPKRVCIVGASYGGYAALAGAALDTGVYRCAASVSGPSDLRRFVQWSREQNGVSALRYWTRFMGADDSRDPVLAEISPAAHVDAITIPVLLIHGRDDTVVPLEQSRIMADAMTKAGKPVELIVQPRADHWLSRGDTRLQTLEAIVTFLEKNNPPS